MITKFQTATNDELLEFFNNNEFLTLEQTKVHDWPSGKSRVTMQFEVERDKRGRQRVARSTGTSKPKRTTYFDKVRIVQVDTFVFILGLTEYNQIVLLPGTLKHPKYVHNANSPTDDEGRKANEIFEFCKFMLG